MPPVKKIRASEEDPSCGGWVCTVYLCPPVHILYLYCVPMSPCTHTVPVLCTYVPLYTYCTCTVYLCPPVHILYLYCVPMSPCTHIVPVLCTYVPLYTYCTCTVYLCPPVHVLYLYCVPMSPCTHTVPVLCTYVPLYTRTWWNSEDPSCGGWVCPQCHTLVHMSCVVCRCCHMTPP